MIKQRQFNQNSGSLNHHLGTNRKPDLLDLEKALKLEESLGSTNIIESFSHAISGIKETIACERNFRIHLCCAMTAICLGLALNINLLSWLILIQVISLVLTTELVNTALEHLVDLAAQSRYHPIAKAAKDTAAGAVLVSSIFAIISGLFIFVPPLLPHYHRIIDHIFR